MRNDPLALSASWGNQRGDQSDIAPLRCLENALEHSSLRRGIPREQFLRELLQDLNHRQLIPLLWMLPRGWRQRSAQVPERLRGLAALIEEGLLSPVLLAALADDLQHLIPAPAETQANALSRWRSVTISLNSGAEIQLPESIATARQQARPTGLEQQALPSTWETGLKEKLGSLGSGLVWRNEGLDMLQTPAQRAMNQLLAQVFNALAANRLPQSLRKREAYCFEGISCAAALIRLLENRDWRCRGRIRASVASFGLGASQPDEARGWQQIPLAVPYRTALEDQQGQELMALLPHCSFELELHSPEDELILLQYYQGTEGLNGWAAMNDLHRPWQNDRHNGTVAYPGLVFTGEQLGLALTISELMGAVHNWVAMADELRIGGYGALGFCIDSTALLHQAVCGCSVLYPLTLGGLWRERLSRSLSTLLEMGLMIDADSVDRYRAALENLPQDLFLHGPSRDEAWQRLITSQPAHSPFETVRALNGEAAAARESGEAALS